MKHRSLIVLQLFLLLAPLAAQAAIFNNIGELVKRVCVLAGYMFAFLVLLAVIFILVAAFQYLTAAGDPKKIQTAHLALTYAAVGIAAGFIASGVPYVIASFLNVGNVGAC